MLFAMIVYGIVALVFSGLIGWLADRLNQVADAETELRRRAGYQARLVALEAHQAVYAAGRSVPGSTIGGIVSPPSPGAAPPAAQYRPPREA